MSEAKGAEKNPAKKTGESASAASKEGESADTAESAAATKGKDYAGFAKLLMGMMAVEKPQGGTAQEVLKVEATGVEEKTELKGAGKSLGTAAAKAADETGVSKALKPTGEVVKALAVKTVAPKDNTGPLQKAVVKADVGDATKPVDTQNTTPDASTAQIAAESGGEAVKSQGASGLAGAVSSNPSGKPTGAISTKPVAEAPTKPVAESVANTGDGKVISKTMEEIVSAVSQPSEKAGVDATAPKAAEEVRGGMSDAARAMAVRLQQQAQPGTPEEAVKAVGKEVGMTAQVVKTVPAVEVAAESLPARSSSSDDNTVAGVQNAQSAEARHTSEAQAAGPARRSAGASLPRQVTDSLIDSAKLYRAGRNSRIEVRLSPPELGKVAISIRKQGNTIEGVLSVERPETRRALEDVAAQVIRGLADSGVNVRRIQVVQTGQETGARGDTQEEAGGQLGNQGRHGERSSGSDSASYDIPASDRDEDPDAVQQSVEDGALNLLV